MTTILYSTVIAVSSPVKQQGGVYRFNSGMLLPPVATPSQMIEPTFHRVDRQARSDLLVGEPGDENKPDGAAGHPVQRELGWTVSVVRVPILALDGFRKCAIL